MSQDSESSSSAASTGSKTPLFAETQYWLQSEFEAIRTRQVGPWKSTSADGLCIEVPWGARQNDELRVVDFHGQEVVYRFDIMFDLPEGVICDLVRPFIKSIVVRAVISIEERAGERGFQTDAALLEAKPLLLAEVDRIYREIAEIKEPGIAERDAGAMRAFVNDIWAGRLTGARSEDAPESVSQGPGTSKAEIAPDNRQSPSKAAVIEEFERRRDAGELLRSLTREAAHLKKWLEEEDLPSIANGTIQNAIRDAYRRWECSGAV